jgi:hypothetical protein
MGHTSSKNTDTSCRGKTDDYYSSSDEVLEEPTPKLHRIISFRSFGDDFDMAEALTEGAILQLHNAFVRRVAQAIMGHVGTRRSTSASSKTFDES